MFSARFIERIETTQSTRLQQIKQPLLLWLSSCSYACQLAIKLQTTFADSISSEQANVKHDWEWQADMSRK